MTPSRTDTRRRIIRIALYTLCIVLAVLFLLPIFWSAMTSVKPPQEASAAPPTYWPSTITLANYVKLNTYGAGVYQYVFNSTAVAILTVIGTILLSTLGRLWFFPFRVSGQECALRARPADADDPLSVDPDAALPHADASCDYRIHWSGWPWSISPFNSPSASL